MAKAKVKKVVLAYSGGLDTSVIIPWLKENYDGCEVIAACVDIGQGDEVAPVHDKALKSGASKAYVEDLTQEFLEDYVWPTLKAQAVYEGIAWGLLPEAQCSEYFAAQTLVKLAQNPVEFPLYWQHWDINSPVLEKVSRRVADAAHKGLLDS